MRCVSERRVGDITVLELASRAMLGELNTDVTDKVEQLLAQGREAFVFNLAAVSSLDSNGLGDLVGARAAAKRRGVVIKLCNVHERVAHPLRIMKLSASFDTFDTEELALQSFASNPPAGG